MLLPTWAEALWGSERTTTPWYPTMRLFRQIRRGNWGPIVERVRRELAELVRRR